MSNIITMLIFFYFNKNMVGAFLKILWITCRKLMNQFHFEEFDSHTFNVVHLSKLFGFFNFNFGLWLYTFGVPYIQCRLLNLIHARDSWHAYYYRMEVMNYCRCIKSTIPLPFWLCNLIGKESVVKLVTMYL